MSARKEQPILITTDAVLIVLEPQAVCLMPQDMDRRRYADFTIVIAWFTDTRSLVGRPRKENEVSVRVGDDEGSRSPRVLPQ
jgi:hypothetical protein